MAETTPQLPTSGADESGTVPEMQLLFECGRPPGASANAGRIEALLTDALDWDRVRTLAIGHRMLPLVLKSLERFIHLVPERALARMRQFEQQNAMRMLGIAADALILMEAAAERGILVLPYKGPFLSWQLYGVSGMRQARDLDLVVRRSDVEPMRQLLLEFGYTEPSLLLEKRREFMLRSRYSAGFSAPGGSALELHWAFTNADYAYPQTLDQLAPLLEHMRIDGHRVPVLPLDELVLLSCVHGTKHSWQRLELVCSLAVAAVRLTPREWDDLFGKAEARGVRRMVHVGLLLAHRLVGLTLPRSVLLGARSDRECVALVQTAASRLRAGLVERESMGLEDDLFHYRARERRRDRIRFLAYRITTPSDPEQWHVLTVGRFVIPLHAFIRPFRLLFRLIPLLLRSRHVRSGGAPAVHAGAFDTVRAR